MLSTFGKAISRAAEKNFVWQYDSGTSVERVPDRKIRCSFADTPEGIAIAPEDPNGTLQTVLHTEVRHV
jgi:hypothetical protein